MKNLFVIVFVLIFSTVINAQFDTNREVWINDLEVALKEPNRVYNLDLSEQHLTEIPKEIEAFTNLTNLKLSDNRITDLSDVLKSLKHLIFVELSGNELREVDFTIFKNSNMSLEEIWLRDNRLTTIDSSINCLENLLVLNIGQNRIQKLDASIDLPILRVLKVDNNHLKTTPEMLINSPKLRYLNINANEISNFTLSLNFRNLNELNLSDNPITKFEIEPGKLKLQVLILDWISIDESLLNNFPKTLRVLSMEHCDLKNIDSIVHLRNLKELSLMHNDLKELPQEIYNFKILEKLWISGNYFTDNQIEILKKELSATVK
ncbi:MAG: leucine-rich repeat domain-containing protein [Saprospiraceae bacterium]